MTQPDPAIVPVVMAGGAGVRFWPLSTESRPKQFMTAFTERSLYQMTIDRARRLSTADRVLVMTNESLVGQVSEQSPEIPRRNIVLEPHRRDTGPALTLAAALVEKRWPGSVMVCLASDHLIRDTDGFCDTVHLAARRSLDGGLGTLGISPTYPATGYGYLKVADADDSGIHTVERFVEKPDRSRAEQFLASGRYFWNSGMFVWKTSVFLDATREFLPRTSESMAAVAAAWGTPGYEAALAKAFGDVQPVSVDFGVMERASPVWMVAASFDWNDIGGWKAAMDLLQADENHNHTRGRVRVDRGSGNLVMSTDPRLPVLCVGVSDTIVVATAQGTLVCHKDCADDLKPLVQSLLQ